MRIIFMGSPEFAVPSLEKLVEAGYEVAAVYTQPDRQAGRGRAVAFSPVKQAALRLGIPVAQPENFKSVEDLARLAELKPGIIVVCAYGQILPKALLEIPPKKCINVHFSLLPRHRGASPVAAALLAGDEFTGVTIMIVEPKLDSGPVLSMAAVPVSPRDNTGALTGKLGSVGADLLAETLAGWLRGDIVPVAQDNSKATYFSQIKKEEGRIDWALSTVEIGRRVRAFNPWPGCYTTWRGKHLEIIAAEALAERGKGVAGTVAALTGHESGLGIVTIDGILNVLTLQLEGKKAMSAAEFLRGQRDIVGAVLPG